ncbi:MAG TPA: beta-ketoacyl-ACP synthase II [Phycisphaerae bacterium]|nr:beta-ketoacyl-ACP synthase II [Phycisphaerae bacterium]
MANRRVVLTGLGTVNPLGHNVEEFWADLLACKSGIRPIRRFDTTGFASQIGGEVQNWETIPSDRIDSREAKRMDRFSQFAVAGAFEAVDDSGLDYANEASDRCGVIVGTGIGGLQELEDQHKRMLDRGPGRVSPFTVPKLMGNAASAHISIVWHLQGPNFCTVTACASGANAVGEAYRTIQQDEADVIISGGSEAAVTPIGLASFCALKGLSRRNDDPTAASRPFDKDRDGFLLSEGAGIVIIEELSHALARGARIYCELIGYGSSADAYHITAPDPEGNGAVLAMQDALHDGELAPEKVDYINVHGTSTVLGDLSETRAIKRVFGDHATKGLVVSSTKSSTGHLLGASGGVELIVCAKAIENGVLPATLNLDEPDDECDLDYVPKTPREAKLDIVLSNSFGFGGHNACLLVRRFTG